MDAILYSDGKYIRKIQDMHADKIPKEDMDRSAGHRLVASLRPIRSDR